MIAQLFIRNTQRLFAMNARFFSTGAPNATNNFNPNSTFNNERNFRKDRPDFRRNNNTERYNKRDDAPQEREEKPRNEAVTWDEYFNIYASNKIHSIGEVKFPFNYRGMKDFVPIKKEFDNMIFAKGENYADFCKQFDRRMVWFMKALASNKDEEFPFCEINFLL